MEKNLSRLIEMARGVHMTAHDREEQRRSLAFGNIGLERRLEGQPIRREDIDECADRMASSVEA
jgi:hypothetical protein